MTKGLLNSKEQINRLCFIDQLINKYYNSTDMTEVLDYISWRSPTICYNSCQGASLGNFKGERKYQFEKIYRQILLLTIPSRNPNVWVFFLSSLTWKMQILFKKKLTENNWDRLKKMGKNGEYSWKKKLQLCHCRSAFMVVEKYSQVLLTPRIWHMTLETLGQCKEMNPNFPGVSHLLCPALWTPKKPHSHGRPLTYWIWYSAGNLCISVPGNFWNKKSCMLLRNPKINHSCARKTHLDKILHLGSLRCL